MKLQLLVLLGSVLALSAPRADVQAAEGDVSFSVSPESAYTLLDETVRSANESIELNIYMLTNRSINEALAARAAGD